MIASVRGPTGNENVFVGSANELPEPGQLEEVRSRAASIHCLCCKETHVFIIGIIRNIFVG